jgi:hypothetical protein
MPMRNKPLPRRQEKLDREQERARRGRPGARRSEIVGRAENYRQMFWTRRLDRKRKEWVRDNPQEWAEQLLRGQSEQEVAKALNSAPQYAQGQLRPLIPLILKVLKGPRFPKRPQTRLDFLADSLAAYGQVSPRSSRDICEEARAKERKKSPHHILRKEFYVECSCGYKGPARDSTCRKCGAEIPPSIGELLAPNRF